jgi:hypothetical protein
MDEETLEERIQRNNREKRKKCDKRRGEAEKSRRQSANRRARQEILANEFNVQIPNRRATPAMYATIKELKEFLRHTYAGTYENFSHFTSKQINFLRHYAKAGRKGIAAAAKAAGYQGSSSNILWLCGSAVLKQPFADDLLRLFEIEEKARMKITVEEVVKWFNDIATQAMESGDFTNANRAMENLAKYLGMFVERKEVTHRVVASREELDARIAELNAVLKEAGPEIDARLNADDN